MREFRCAQGRQHTLASGFSILILARRSGFYGPLAAAQFAAALSQEELEAIGGWRNPTTGRYEPASKSTLHRVMQPTDPEQLEAILGSYTAGRINHLAVIAGDGKRICGANRNGDSPYETVALVEQGTGLPKANLSFHHQGEELDVARRLLSETEVSGRLVPLDALHWNFEPVELILAAGADYLLRFKDKTALQLDWAQGLRWSSCRVRRYSGRSGKGSRAIGTASY